MSSKKSKKKFPERKLIKPIQHDEFDDWVVDDDKEEPKDLFGYLYNQNPKELPGEDKLDKNTDKLADKIGSIIFERLSIIKEQLVFRLNNVENSLRNIEILLTVIAGACGIGAIYALFVAIAGL